MKRRAFLKTLLFTPFVALFPNVLFALSQRPNWKNLLILVELKGGNDGLNTVIPYSDERYYQLRPRLAVPRDQVLHINDHIGLHPSLEKLMPTWQDKALAIIQGVGYPNPNLSHFRSIEIWETATDSDETLTEGWLSRLFAQNPPPMDFAADGVIVDGQTLGPLNGLKTRAVVLPRRQNRWHTSSPEDHFHPVRPNPALAHILKVEDDYDRGAKKLIGHYDFRTDFPQNPFGNTIRKAAQIVASQTNVAVIKVSLGGFDTHGGQLNPHTQLLKQLGDGLHALQQALAELHRWDSTLIMTYSEFGRRPKENMSLGTDHGTASVHFMLGGHIKGGLYGIQARLQDLDNGNLRHQLDFRSLYATVIEKWWDTDHNDVLGGNFPVLDVLKS